MYSDASVNDKCEDFIAYLRKEGGFNVRTSAAVVPTSDPMDSTAVRAIRASTMDPDMGATSLNIEMAAIDMAGLVGGDGAQAAIGETDSQSSDMHLQALLEKAKAVLGSSARREDLSGQIRKDGHCGFNRHMQNVGLQRITGQLMSGRTH